MVTCAQWFASITAQQQQQQQQATLPTAAQQQQVVRVLVFNCMKERDPSVLLPQLHAELQRQGCGMHVALFIPPDSQYAFLPSSKTSALVTEAHADLSWQQQLRDVWQQCETAAAGAAPGGAGKAAAAVLVPLPSGSGVLKYLIGLSAAMQPLPPT
jgi:hypothetical protein